MRDGFAGDVGDFGKYGLLNELCSADGRGGPALTLGVLWYAPCYRCVAEESGTQTDGQKTDYLLPDKCRPFRQCDPRLWEKMHSIVHGHRSIAAVERSEALLAGTKYHSEPQVCGFHGPHSKKEEKEKQRRIWLRGGQMAVKGTDLVFVDPDNGFQVKTIESHHKGGPKYVYYADLDAHVEAGQSLVIYHHLCREAKKSHVDQIRERLDVVDKRFNLGKRAFALHFKRGTGRAYFVLPNPAHSDLLAERAERLTDSLWGHAGHFDQCIYRPNRRDERTMPRAGAC